MCILFLNMVLENIFIVLQLMAGIQNKVNAKVKVDKKENTS